MMTIHLSEEREQMIRSLMETGKFSSTDAVIDEALRLVVQHHEGPKDEAASGLTADGLSKPADSPIWERILEMTADIPDEVGDKLPTDLASQHDHYIAISGQAEATADRTAWQLENLRQLCRKLDAMPNAAIDDGLSNRDHDRILYKK